MASTLTILKTHEGIEVACVKAYLPKERGTLLYLTSGDVTIRKELTAEEALALATALTQSVRIHMENDRVETNP